MHAPLRPAFQAEWRGLAALEPIAAEWRDLAARAIEPNVFYAPAFALAAAPAFGAGVGAVLVRTAGGRLAGLFPARILRWRSAAPPMMVGWTHPFAPLGTPLVDCEQPEAVVAAWLDHLGRDPHVPPRLLLPLVPEQGAFAKTLDTVLAAQGRRSAAFGGHERALLAPGAQREGYVTRAISPLRQKKLRRQRRLLQDIAPVSFATTIEAAGMADALQDFLALEASGWKGAAGTAIVNDPATSDFVKRAVLGLAADRQARIDRLMVGGSAVAATLTLFSGDTAWGWKIAYDEALARASPGLQLMHHLTDSLLAEPRTLRVDSCASAGHPMIDHLWRERLAVSDRLIALRPCVMPFALACRIETLRRSATALARAARHRIRRAR